jgi:hypothetical protein
MHSKYAAISISNSCSSISRLGLGHVFFQFTRGHSRHVSWRIRGWVVPGCSKGKLGYSTGAPQQHVSFDTMPTLWDWGMTGAQQRYVY